jgi:hypothetical protein
VIVEVTVTAVPAAWPFGTAVVLMLGAVVSGTTTENDDGVPGAVEGAVVLFGTVAASVATT